MYIQLLTKQDMINFISKLGYGKDSIKVVSNPHFSETNNCATISYAIINNYNAKALMNCKAVFRDYECVVSWTDLTGESDSKTYKRKYADFMCTMISHKNEIKKTPITMEQYKKDYNNYYIQKANEKIERIKEECQETLI